MINTILPYFIKIIGYRHHFLYSKKDNNIEMKKPQILNKIKTELIESLPQANNFRTRQAKKSQGAGKKSTMDAWKHQEKTEQQIKALLKKLNYCL